MTPKLSPAQALILHGHPREAMQFLGSNPGDRFMRAVCLRHIGELHESLGIVNALILDPKNVPLHALWNTRGMIETDLGFFEECMKSFEMARDILSRDPNPKPVSYRGDNGLSQIQLNLAYAYMRLGRFAEAWPLWESSRFGWSWNAPVVPWGGQPGRVLVICEGGYGDQFLFPRWFSAARKLADITYYVHEGLKDLIPYIPSSKMILHPAGTFVSTDALNIDWSKFDYATAVMSLPAICGMQKIEDIPAPNLQFSEMWIAHPKKLKRAGLCWAAQENGVQRRTRTIPPEDLTRLNLARPDGFISLAPGYPRPEWIEDFRPRSWLDTFDLLASLPYVVTVDTAVGHLAGMMGIPTYMLLPVGSDWKYFTRDLVGDRSPWYPSVKLIRNTHPTSWRPAINYLLNELEADGRI